MIKAFRGARLLMALVLILTVAVSLFILPGFANSLVILGLLGIAFATWIPYLGNVREQFSFRQFWRSELAAVIPTFYYARSGIPGGSVLINGSQTPPTAQQASQIPLLKVQMVMTDGVVQGTITHNWGLDKSAPTYLDPEIWYWCQNSTDGAPGATWLPMLTFDLTNTNVVLVNKIVGAAATPTGGTYIITLRNNAAMLASAGSAS